MREKCCLGNGQLACQVSRRPTDNLTSVNTAEKLSVHNSSGEKFVPELPFITISNTA